MPRKTSQKEEEKHKSANTYIIVAAIVFIVVAAAVYELVGIVFKSNTSGSFGTFKSNFNSAQRVAIYATAYNGTVLSSTVGCATMIIENIVGSSQTHRNASTIDLFIINETRCTYTMGLGLGSNGTETSLSDCLNRGSSEPTIYLNYSLTNTTVIKPNYLYTSGDRLFLNECGIATEIR